MRWQDQAAVRLALELLACSRNLSILYIENPKPISRSYHGCVKCLVRLPVVRRKPCRLQVIHQPYQGPKSDYYDMCNWFTPGKEHTVTTVCCGPGAKRLLSSTTWASRHRGGACRGTGITHLPRHRDIEQGSSGTPTSACQQLTIGGKQANG